MPIRPLQIRSLPIRALLPLLLLGLAWAQELVDQLLFGGGWNLAMGPGQPWWTLFVPIQGAGRPPRQSIPDRLMLRGQGIGGVS